MHRAVWWGIVFVFWIAILAGVYYWWTQSTEDKVPTSVPPVAEKQPAPPAAEPEPQIRHPIAEAQPGAEQKQAPLPPLNESDKVVAQSLASVLGQRAVSDLLNTNGFVRRVVATIDNLPRKRAAPHLWPTNPPGGRFATKGGDDSVYLSPDNYRRYAPFARLIESADTGKLVALYVDLYPLFQQAYVELGYPKGYFNDRLVEVIDHLLATPEMKEPIKLAKPWVMYEFADPDLEARSAGQKMLMRMGGENAAKVKAKLREIRQQVTGAAAPR